METQSITQYLFPEGRRGVGSNTEIVLPNLPAFLRNPQVTSRKIILPEDPLFPSRGKIAFSPIPKHFPRLASSLVRDGLLIEKDSVCETDPKVIVLGAILWEHNGEISLYTAERFSQKGPQKLSGLLNLGPLGTLDRVAFDIQAEFILGHIETLGRQRHSRLELLKLLITRGFLNESWILPELLEECYISPRTVFNIIPFGLISHEKGPRVLVYLVFFQDCDNCPPTLRFEGEPDRASRFISLNEIKSGGQNELQRLDTWNSLVLKALCRTKLDELTSQVTFRVDHEGTVLLFRVNNWREGLWMATIPHTESPAWREDDRLGYHQSTGFFVYE